ncbi:MAG: GNAT family N-acetyltransferase [Coxiellaceae bacterium]|nr:GNAT family N-acetyltransferase [Coxiellaceae bacterium]
MMAWRDNLSSSEWDTQLAKMGGHPLQSALWGDARIKFEGIIDQRLALYDKENIVALVRAEMRGLKLLFTLIWIPQGPALSPDVDCHLIYKKISDKLKKNANVVCATYPWAVKNTEGMGSRKTIWIDLKKGKEKLWADLDSQWRYGVRRAEREGAIAYIAQDEQELEVFYHLCQQVSQNKKFQFNVSIDFMRFLLKNGNDSGVSAKLFVTKYQNDIAAGALILKVGKHIHYMWGAVDRRYSKVRVGEFIQWAVINWACDQGCERYDLEGIDENANPGTAAFKKKMGGEEIVFPSADVVNIGFRGKIIASFIKKKLGVVEAI